MFKKSKGNTSPPLPRTHRMQTIEVCLIALLSFMLLSSLAFGQGASASLSGTITDASRAVIPGATVTARNIDTGIESRTTSNSSGIYNFASLQVGVYNVTVEATGFVRAVRTDLRLTVGSQASLSIELAVIGTVTEVEVTGTIESIILDAGSSTGTFFQAETLMEIPLVGSNIMDVLNMMGGVVPTSDAINNPGGQTFAGVAASGINLTRDGMSINEVRWGSGITGNTTMNQETIGEFKMVLSAVDAEMGRGAGQVQTTTRSGSNAYHGSGVWNIQNTSLDAREFERKKRGDPPNWRNLNDYILTASGPIIRNKTFFFVSWERQYNMEKQNINARVMTPCARKGIYRYIGDMRPNPSGDGTYLNDGWVPQNLIATPSFNVNRARPSIKPDGTPLVGPMRILNPGSNDNYTDVDGQLHFESIFGELTSTNRALLADSSKPGSAYDDCSSLVFDGPSGNYGVENNTYWGSGIYARAWDTTGYIQNFTNGVSYSAGKVVMPPVNNWDIGDGLNLAGHRWVYRARGITTVYGTGGDVERKAINLKVDHNINNEHRLSGSWTWQKDDGDMAQQQWPSEFGGYAGVNSRYPQNFMATLTSTLRPTLLNELRFGYVSQNSYTNDALHGKYGSEMQSVLESLMPTGAGTVFAGTPFQDRMMLVFPGSGIAQFSTDNDSGLKSHPWSTRDGIGTAATWGGKDYRLTFADTITWMKDAHSFKGGVEFRYQQSYQDYTGGRAFAQGGNLIREPSLYGGMTVATNTRRQTRRPLGAANDACRATGTGSWCGLAEGSTDAQTLNGNFSTPYDMMTYFSGSVNQIRQLFYLSAATNDWNDITKGEDLQAYQIMNKEFSFFFKDDWKLTPNLTLNLGVRYEYFGVPYNWKGYTPALKGGSINVFGLSKDLGWERWMNGRDTGYVYDDPGPIMDFEYVGPGSPNSGRGAWKGDFNNFAPHVGFAWQLPWFGKGLTTLRGGYSISYTPVDNFDQYGVRVGDVSGTGQSTVLAFRGQGSQSYTGTGPGGIVGPDDHGYDSAYYMDLSDMTWVLPMKDAIPDHIKPMVTRLTGQFYAGATTTDENIRNPMVHSVNMSLTRNIGRALTVDVRYVGTLSRKQVVSTNLNTVNYISNGLYLELDKVRRGEQSTLINSLIPTGVLSNAVGATTGSDQLRAWNTTAPNLARGNFQGVASSLATTNGILTTPDPLAQGMVLRSGCLPGDRATQNDITTACTRSTPWNYFSANPQFSGPSQYYNGALANYNSMQAQVTLRPTRGLNFQATYTWSRSLGNSGWTNYTGDRFEDRDYQLASQHRSHALNTFGTWELPFGSNGFFFRDASGVFKKTIEGWQISWITAMTSGSPMSVTGNSSLWSDSSPILVRPDLWDNKAGHAKVEWTDDGTYIGGQYFGRKYTTYALDTVLCDNTVQGYNTNPGAANPHTGLYSSYCSSSSHGTTGLPVPASGAPRVLALASGQAVDGNMLPALYTEDTIGADGVLYKAGTPIVVMRNSDQRLGEKAAGNFRPNQLTGVGRFSFDLAMSKSLEFMEGKRLEIRVDAQNILNHATPSNSYTTYAPSLRQISITSPSLSLASNNFGYILTKVGRRTYQAKIRLSF